MDILNRVVRTELLDDVYNFRVVRFTQFTTNFQWFTKGPFEII